MPDELSSQLSSLRIDRSVGAPVQGGNWRKRAAALAGAGAVAVLYFLALPRIEDRLFQKAVSITEVSSVSPAGASVQLTSAGYVMPQRVSRIAPKVTGRVAEVFVVQGQHVEPGQLLVRLDATDERATIAAAKTRVAAAWARAESAKASAATLRAELAEGQLQSTRQQLLSREGVGATGAAEDLLARVRSLRQRAAAAQADAQAAAAAARVEVADLQALETALDNLTLRSPISGTVVTQPPQPGEVVSPQPPGVSVDMGSLQIADFDSLMVETDVPEQRLHMIQTGGPTEIVLDAFPNRRYRGTTSEVTPEVDRSKATVVVRVAFLDEKDGVLPNMAARVSFLSEPLDARALEQAAKIVVPGAAVVERDGQRVVFVVENGVARRVSVRLGAPFGNGFEVIDGPRAGTRLVASPPEELIDGQRVKEKEMQ